MSRITLCAMALLAFLSGCASAPVTKVQLPDPANRAEILVFRESAFNAGGVTIAFGANKSAWVKLDNAERSSIYLSPGAYTFFVQARTAEPTELATTLKSGERKCLKTVSDPDNWARAGIPFLMMSKGYHFLLQEVACPSDAELSKYALVKVEYQAN